MQNDDGARLESVTKGLGARLQDLAEWKWDARFDTALAEFEIEREDEILGILDEFLTQRWDSTSVGDAPETVQDLVRRLGGLMPGQLLFHSEPQRTGFLFCAWWPWGNGQRISIRIAPFAKDLSEEPAIELASVFPGCFGI